MRLGARYAEDVQRYGYVWGVTDMWEDQFVLAPQFEMAADFAEDLGCVRHEGKYGYIDATGQWVIPPQFDHARSFSEGRAVVAVGEQYGYIDHTGQFLIPPQFEAAGDFWRPRTRAKLGGKWGYLWVDGTWAIPPQFDFAWEFDVDDHAYVAQGTKYGRINLAGDLDGWRQAPRDGLPYHRSTPSRSDFYGYAD